MHFERIQYRVTKYILNNYDTYYKPRLLELRLLPVMYIFEIQDILFATKSLKSPVQNFDINNYNIVTFSQGHTRFSTCSKLNHLVQTIII